MMVARKRPLPPFVKIDKMQPFGDLHFDAYAYHRVVHGPPEPQEQPKPRRRRKGHGHGRFPQHIPRIGVEHRVPVDQLPCPGCDSERMSDGCYRPQRPRGSFGGTPTPRPRRIRIAHDMTSVSYVSQIVPALARHCAFEAPFPPLAWPTSVNAASVAPVHGVVLLLVNA